MQQIKCHKNEIRYMICGEFPDRENLENITSYPECDKDFVIERCKDMNANPSRFGKYTVVKAETTFSLVYP